MAKQYNPWTGFLEETSVKTADGLDAPEKNAGYEMKKEGQYFKVYKNGKLISVSSTEEQARREAARHRANSQDEKPTIDKAIRNCDAGEVDILFYVDIDGNKVHETFSSNSAMNSRLNELKKHGIKRFKTWSHAEWTKSESEFRNMFNKMKGSL